LPSIIIFGLIVFSTSDATSLPYIIVEAIAFMNDRFTSKDYNELYRLQNQFRDLRYQVTVIGKSTNSPVLLMFETLTMTEPTFSSVKVKDCCAEPF
jgi:hypothetical protein